MTTAPVLTITEELVAELEQLAGKATPGPWERLTNHGIYSVASADWELFEARVDQPNDASDSAFSARANPATILALLTERAELKRDAERYRYIRLHPYVSQEDWEPIFLDCDSIDAAIDTAMQER